MAYFLCCQLQSTSEEDWNLQKVTRRHGHPVRASEFGRHCAGHITTVPALFMAAYSEDSVNFRSLYAPVAI